MPTCYCHLSCRHQRQHHLQWGSRRSLSRRRRHPSSLLPHGQRRPLLRTLRCCPRQAPQRSCWIPVRCGSSLAARSLLASRYGSTAALKPTPCAGAVVQGATRRGGRHNWAWQCPMLHPHVRVRVRMTPLRAAGMAAYSTIVACKSSGRPSTACKSSGRPNARIRWHDMCRLAAVGNGSPKCANCTAPYGKVQ